MTSGALHPRGTIPVSCSPLQDSPRDPPQAKILEISSWCDEVRRESARFTGCVVPNSSAIPKNGSCCAPVRVRGKTTCEARNILNMALQPTSNGLHPSNKGLHPSSDGLQPNNSDEATTDCITLQCRWSPETMCLRAFCSLVYHAEQAPAMSIAPSETSLPNHTSLSMHRFMSSISSRWSLVRYWQKLHNR